jgi:hypothetical protein
MPKAGLTIRLSNQQHLREYLHVVPVQELLQLRQRAVTLMVKANVVVTNPILLQAAVSC